MIRRSLEPKPDALTRLAQRDARVYERNVRVTASTRAPPRRIHQVVTDKRVTADDILADRA